MIDLGERSSVGVDVGAIFDNGVPVDLDAVAGSADRPQSWMAGGFNMQGRLWMKRLSKDRKLPDWQQIALYGWGAMRKDGHFPLREGELAEMLGKPRMRNDKLKDQIDIAVQRDWLGVGSNRRCLVMPFDLRYLTTRDVHSLCDRH